MDFTDTVTEDVHQFAPFLYLNAFTHAVAASDARNPALKLYIRSELSSPAMASSHRSDPSTTGLQASCKTGFGNVGLQEKQSQ